MSTGNQNAVGPFLQGLHDIKRIDPSRAGNADNPHIRRILDPADPSQIGSGVSAPVADDGNDFRFPSLFAKFSAIYSPSSGNAALSAVYLSLYIIYLCQHFLVVEAVQIDGVHPAGGRTDAATLAENRIDDGAAFHGSTAMAPKGQLIFAKAAGRASFLIHKSRLAFRLDKILRQDRAGPGNGGIGLDMASSLSFGAWDMPHIKTPSVAKSTGRSFTWASRKKPSWFVGHLQHLADVLIFRIGHGADAEGQKIGLQIHKAVQDGIEDPDGNLAARPASLPASGLHRSGRT